MEGCTKRASFEWVVWFEAAVVGREEWKIGGGG